MNTLQKGKYNLLILLVYLITIQVGAGTAFYSIYVAVSNGTTYLEEQTPKSGPKDQIILRKHLNVSNNEKSSNSTAFVISTFSLPEINDFVYIQTTHQLTPLTLTAYGKLSDRAPPQIS